MFQLSVECRQTEEGEMFPEKFGWPKAMRQVLDVLDWWPGEDHSYFRLKGDDGNIYIVRHYELEDTWDLVFYETGSKPVSATQRVKAVVGGEGI
jgi:hypothetical protein